MFDKTIRIGKREISQNSPTYFIADIAANHDGDIKRAKELIYLAKEAGADCAKFQHFLPEKIVSDYGFKNLNSCQSHQSNWKKSVFEIYDDYHCKREWTMELVKTCKENDIEFMTTPYDFEILPEINKHVNAYKVGSGDITWIDFLKEIAKLNKPVLLASGASTLEDVKRAMMAINEYNSKVVLMQCNTNYTGNIENYKYINLNVLNLFKQEFPNAILGLSDHTFGYTCTLGAVALGAKVIEKHFTDDNNREGPDHKFAMNPKTWKEMVTKTRELELALGDGIKRIEENEKNTVVVQRRCARLKISLEAGSTVTEENIEFLRPAPADSIFPYDLKKILGKKLNKDKIKGDYLKFEDFCA